MSPEVRADRKCAGCGYEPRYHPELLAQMAPGLWFCSVGCWRLYQQRNGGAS